MTKKNSLQPIKFSQLIEGVVPLQSKKNYTPLKSIKSKIPTRSLPPDNQPKDASVMWSDESETISVSEYKKVGVQNRVIQKLKRDQYPITHQVDLHGLTINQARSTLQEVLRTAQRDSMTAILIVHGKGLNSSQGKSVLKPRFEAGYSKMRGS